MDPAAPIVVTIVVWAWAVRRAGASDVDFCGLHYGAIAIAATAAAWLLYAIVV